MIPPYRYEDHEDRLAAAVPAHHPAPLPGQDPPGTGPFTCPGCGFRFAGRTPGATACQYCGHPVPALPAAPEPGSAQPPEPGGAQPPVHAPGCGCTDCAVWVREFLAVLCEPLGWPDEGLLPSWDKAPPNTCGRCHRGPLYKNLRCVYCHALENPDPGGAARPGSAPAFPPCTARVPHRYGGDARCGRCRACRDANLRARLLAASAAGAGILLLAVASCGIMPGLVVPGMALVIAGAVLLLALSMRGPR